MNAPFVDIFAGIDGAMETHYPERKFQGGDLYDNPILAVALPYCDVVTTDKFRKEILVNILHHDEKYQCGILSAVEGDRRQFQTLVRELAL